ncbi:MAG: hypothetical protein CMQ05_08690 [Gammaproteobacteria bacterium]|uniref:PilZ domain-containing protein n=1 Tax=OM182 bacterium MED-G24 TaxID=1986255 RepID=A0A2A5WS85_9GAMM|nr:hypothetical protein [Gammaproteobacteria bacterium]PDH39410.1 MAG: hypothetical protein CNE99_05720 [OM182 bacterium MED-G24]RPG24430.1 MAG: hypothetical protein CBC10_011480 [Gammaproteobacteria bacterium TMED50]
MFDLMTVGPKNEINDPFPRLFLHNYSIINTASSDVAPQARKIEVLSMRLDRIETQETVLIDIADCPERPELDDTHMSAITVDISKEGLKMGSNIEIPVGSFLGMRVSIRGRLFRLEGEVRWHLREDGAWFSGVHLRDSSPDLAEWREMFQVDVEWRAPLRVQAV